MIFFIKRKCFDDVRGVRGFGLVLLQQAPSDFFDSFRIQFSDAERVDEPSIDCACTELRYTMLEHGKYL